MPDLEDLELDLGLDLDLDFDLDLELNLDLELDFDLFGFVESERMLLLRISICSGVGRVELFGVFSVGEVLCWWGRGMREGKRWFRWGWRADIVRLGW